MDGSSDVEVEVARLRTFILRRLLRNSVLTTALCLVLAAGMVALGVSNSTYDVRWTLGFLIGALTGLTFRLVMVVRNGRKPRRLLEPFQRQGYETASGMLTPSVWRNFGFLAAGLLAILAYGAPPAACFAIGFFTTPWVVNVLVYWRFERWFGPAYVDQGVYRWYFMHESDPLISGSQQGP